MRVNGVGLPVVLADRRPGDIERIHAETSKAERARWKATHLLADALRAMPGAGKRACVP